MPICIRIPHHASVKDNTLDVLNFIKQLLIKLYKIFDVCKVVITRGFELEEVIQQVLYKGFPDLNRTGAALYILGSPFIT